MLKFNKHNNINYYGRLSLSFPSIRLRNAMDKQSRLHFFESKCNAFNGRNFLSASQR